MQVDQLLAVQDPSSYLHEEWLAVPRKLSDLQAIVGKGHAPAIQSIANNVSTSCGCYSGGLYVASEAFVERFVLEGGVAPLTAHLCASD